MIESKRLASFLLLSHQTQILKNIQLFFKFVLQIKLNEVKLPLIKVNNIEVIMQTYVNMNMANFLGLSFVFLWIIVE